MSTGLETVAGWPGDRRGAGWVARDGRSATEGDVDEVLRLASVTKLLTATAVLLAVEEEVVDLDEAAGPPGATVRLLLCHASGLPFDGATPIAEPGRRRIYGNTAFEVLGRLLEERTAVPLADYVREGVLEPLEMRSTTMAGSPAHGARSTVTDLLRFGGELLAPGTVLAPDTVTAATAVQLPDLPGVLPGFGRQAPNTWGLGFEIRDHKSPHWMPATASPRTFGHFGQSGSFLWVDPDAGIACASLTSEGFGDWARAAWPELGDAVLREATAG